MLARFATEQGSERRPAGAPFDNLGDLCDFSYDLAFDRVSFDVNDSTNRLRKTLRDLMIMQSLGIRMGLHDLEETVPDMFRTRGVDGEGGVPMAGGCGTDRRSACA